MRYTLVTEAAGELIRDARRAEGLSQAQLARRMRTSQSTVARLEGGRANPTITTLDKALRACGHTLDLASTRLEHQVDETLIAAQLKMTPAQRLALMELEQRRVKKIADEAKRTRRGRRG